MPSLPHETFSALAGPARQRATRYHPALVALHWLLAILIVAQLAVGFLALAATPDLDPEKIGVLRLHMAGGALILVLMAVRFIVRLATNKPADVTTGFAVLDRMAPLSHYGFYLLVALMAGTGFATAIGSGLNLVVFGPPGLPLPPDVTSYPSFLAHRAVALLLVALVALHALAALHHQFVRRDGLFKRMFFGRRAPIG